MDKRLGAGLWTVLTGLISCRTIDVATFQHAPTASFLESGDLQASDLQAHRVDGALLAPQVDQLSNQMQVKLWCYADKPTRVQVHEVRVQGRGVQSATTLSRQPGVELAVEQPSTKHPGLVKNTYAPVLKMDWQDFEAMAAEGVALTIRATVRDGEPATLRYDFSRSVSRQTFMY